MKVICAWCRQEIKEIPDQSGIWGFEVSHGMCDACQEYFFTDEQVTLDKFLNKLEAPVLMVDPEGTVVLANDKALHLLGKELQAVSGVKGGDVMECAYARLPEGCGSTIHCAACTIRLNVMETFRTGSSLKKVPAFLNRYNRDTIEKIKFLISTEKIADVVLLRIDEVMAG